MNSAPGFSSPCAKTSVFITEANTLLVWGDGHTKDAHVYLELPSTPLTPSPSIVGVAAGTQHILAVTKDAFVIGWGGNQNAQLTGPYSATLTPPTLIAGFPPNTKIRSVHAGSNHSAAVTNDGRLFVWGDNSCYQLGLKLTPTPLKVKLPTLIPLPSPVVDVACGSAHFVVLTESHGLFVWGANYAAQLGLRHTIPKTTPTRLGFPENLQVSRVFAGIQYSMFLTTDGSVYWCGRNNFSGDSNDEDERPNSPKFLFRRKNISELACGGNHVLVLLDDNRLLVWGDNKEGQLGIAKFTKVKAPLKRLKFFQDKKILSIGAGNSFSWALTGTKQLYLWGCNREGQLGFPCSKYYATPVLFPELLFKAPVKFWENIFKWLFLGRTQEESTFCVFPDEILYQFVLLRENF
jgi:alpha-tubulin suppressor-like RCC1 family protein